MINQARQIIKKRFFTTIKDYNALSDGIDYLEQVANKTSYISSYEASVVFQKYHDFDEIISATITIEEIGESISVEVSASYRIPLFDIHWETENLLKNPSSTIAFICWKIN